MQSVTDEDYKFFLALVHANPENLLPAQQVLGSGNILSEEERHNFIIALREWVAKQPKEFQGPYPHLVELNICAECYLQRNMLITLHKKS